MDCHLAIPEPLQRLCLDFICHNLDSVCVKQTTLPSNDSEQTETEEMIIEDDLNFALDQLHKKLTAKIIETNHEKLNFVTSSSDDCLFHTTLSEELLQRLSDLGKINDLILTLFDGQKTSLKRVKIENASKLTALGLQSLSKHHLTELEVSNLVKATVNDLIQCLNPWTLSHLKMLNVSNSTFVDSQKHTIGIPNLFVYKIITCLFNCIFCL